MSQSGPSDEYYLQVTPGETGPTGMTGPPPPPTITLAEILAAQEVLAKLEADDKANVESIGQISIDALRPKLIAWAIAGFPNAYAVHEIVLTPPSTCSDGVVRGLADYIVFCSGKSLTEHVAPIQAMLPDIQVGFVSSPPKISVVVTKA
jgi:hypothetical protein